MFRERLKQFGLWICYLLLKGIVSLRYRVRVEGLENLRLRYPDRGVLFLPNHPAEIDPVLLMLVFWKQFAPRPLVVQYFFEMALVLPFMKLVRALPMPNMIGTSNQWKIHQVEKLFQTISSGLQAGENFIIYPAGRLKLHGEEVLGGASMVHTLLKECPEVNIVLVRTRGLWGSSFSRALTGKVPAFGEKIIQGLKNALKNGLFFLPKREVLVEVELAPEDLPTDRPRLEFNRYLEQWYNQKPDPFKLVSYTFWKETFPEVTASKQGQKSLEKQSIPDQVRQELLEKISHLAHIPVAQIKEESDLATDLGLDSLDIAQIHAFLDDNYDVFGLEAGSLQTVDDVLQAAMGRVKEVAPERERKVLKWPKEGPRKAVEMPSGETLQEVFLRSCDRMGTLTACSDGLMEVCLSYRRLKMAAITLALKMETIPDKYVGIMLPSSVGAYLCILGALLAKKVPVMLNWTVGSKALDHAMEVTGITTVFCARRFLERVENVELGKVEESLILLEEFRSTLTLGQKLKALWLSRKQADFVMDKLRLANVQPDDPAVILFTSGTEALPKGVPLTHRNLLSNQRAAYPEFQAQSSDILYAVLPPFHSFGFSVTGLVPLLIGLKVVFSPDPTDSRNMVADVAHWGATILCAAPSFLKGMFHFAKKDELKTVRLVVSGAEKAPQELFDAVAALPRGAEMLEGYGITECSPIVTINAPHVPSRGVGRPIAGVELCLIDPVTEKRVPDGEEGEICIAGPNVFAGYLGEDKDPFIMLEGKRWYRSGDRGYLDPEGYLILSGRLKRFVKMGGEMVSLGGIEEELNKIALARSWIPESTDVPQLAIGAKEVDGEKPEIILFTTFEARREEVNDELKKSGLGRLVKIARVQQVDEIPLSGTGKIQHRKLEEMA